MVKKIFLILVLCLGSVLMNAQEIEKKWQLGTNDYLELNEGSYKLRLSSDSLFQKGDYLVQDKYLFLFENNSDSPTKRFVIEAATDTTLTLKTKGKAYSFFASNKIKEVKAMQV